MPSAKTARPALAAIALCALTLVGCPEPGAPSHAPCGGGDAGAAACVELRIDETPELIHGPQGGWHLLVATALAGTDGEASTITYEARRTSDDVVLGTVAYRITPRLLRDEGDALVHDDDLLILEIASPEEVVGSELAVSVVLEQSGVVLGQDLRRVVVRDDVEELAGLRAE